MFKKVLISTRGSSEIRIAFTENKKLINLETEILNKKFLKGNIYKGFVTKIEPSLDAIFINYGKEKDGLLPFKEISYKYLECFNLTSGLKFVTDDSSIRGKNIIIQINKEEKEEKGALLTTYLNLAGCYVVLMLSSHRSGVSKNIDGKERKNLRFKLNGFSFPFNISIIIRTFGLGKNFKELKWEVDILLSQIKMIEILSKSNNFPSLIYEEHSLVTKIIRDYFKNNLIKIITDDIKIFNLFFKYLNIIYSEFISNIFLYDNNISLFCYFKIENQIDIIFKREIFLSSGGMITIDCTEALTSIDINSSRFNKCENIEETALQTNLEAVDEITKQIRIRNLTGLIIIDFIDMISQENKKTVEKNVRESLSFDKSKVQIGKISNFGLLEISRQKSKISFTDSNKIVCNKCNGFGKIDNINMLSFCILNSIEEESFRKKVYQIHLELPIELINYLINFKRKKIFNLEKKKNIKIILITNNFISFPDFKIYVFSYNNRKYRLFRKNNFLKNYVWQRPTFA